VLRCILVAYAWVNRPAAGVGACAGAEVQIVERQRCRGAESI